VIFREDVLLQKIM